MVRLEVVQQSRPASAAAFSARRTWSSSVSVPYTSGSRCAEEVQVRSRQQQDRAWASSDRLRGPPTPSTGSTPSTTSRPDGPSSTNVSPRRRTFLSRPISVDQLVGVEVGRNAWTAGHTPTLRGGVRRPRHPRCDPDDGRARPRTRGRSRRPRRGGGRGRRRSRSRGPACGRSSTGPGDPVSRSSDATTSALIRTQRGHPFDQVQLVEAAAAQPVVLGQLAQSTAPLPRRAAWRGSTVSQMTAAGCQNVPTRFLPCGRLTPVLPPMAASIWASSVVATWTTGTPRWYDRCREAGRRR